MAKTEVIWTDSAFKALENIGSYIALEAPERAVSFTEKLFNSTSRLKEFPLSGQVCLEVPIPVAI